MRGGGTRRRYTTGVCKLACTLTHAHCTRNVLFVPKTRKRAAEGIKVQSTKEVPTAHVNARLRVQKRETLRYSVCLCYLLEQLLTALVAAFVIALPLKSLLVALEIEPRVATGTTTNKESAYEFQRGKASSAHKLTR